MQVAGKRARRVAGAMPLASISAAEGEIDACSLEVEATDGYTGGDVLPHHWHTPSDSYFSIRLIPLLHSHSFFLL